VADARVALSGVKLEDAARKAAIDELATKDEATLDGLLKAEVLGNVRKEVVAAVAPVVETKPKEIVAGAQLAAVNDSSNSKPGIVERPVKAKSFASLDNRVSDKRTVR
jgi:hypothetical protein